MNERSGPKSPIEIVAHPGAASGARAVNVNRIYEVVMGALAQVIPDSVIAASSGFCNPKVSGTVSPYGHA